MGQLFATAYVFYVTQKSLGNWFLIDMALVAL